MSLDSDELVIDVEQVTNAHLECKEYDQIAIQTQDKILYTTYATIKNILYLESLYARWTSDRSKPLFIDAPSKLMEELLAKYTVVNREFLGLVAYENKAKLIKLEDTFDAQYLTIYIGEKQIIFKYKNRSQTWKKREDDGKHVFQYGNREWSIGFNDLTLKGLTLTFEEELFWDFISNPPMVDLDTYQFMFFK